MSKSDRTALALSLALIFSMAAVSVGSFLEQCDRIREDTLRLHIIADSDSEYDQQNKLLVRDAVLAEYSELLSGKSAEQAAFLADFLKEEIRLTARKALAAANSADEVAVEVTEMYFDTRSYEQGVTLPAGQYAALRITIGEGKGQNWWCVMYPPLCLPACTAEGKAAEAEREIRSLESRPAYKAKFAVAELAQRLSEALKG